jgi:hypothetical protein
VNMRDAYVLLVVQDINVIRSNNCSDIVRIVECLEMNFELKADTRV